MNRVTILTKLRLVAVIAPVLLVIALAFVALTLFQLGALPSFMYENEYAAMRAAEGMEIALNKMDWGRYQQDGTQIVLDQQRQFGDWIESARSHVDLPEQTQKIDDVSDHARVLFEAMRKASAGDPTLEPQVLDLQARISELISADQGALIAVGNAAESRARLAIIVVLIAGVLVPWACFAWAASMLARINRALRELRRHLENLRERGLASEDLDGMDRNLDSLGFPKPNPMLAE